MPLAIHTVVKDGIIVSSDSRTTCRDGNGNVRYNDTAEKIVPFPNRIIVSHTGDASLTDTLNVVTFLCHLRKRMGLKVSLEELPLVILNEYLKECRKSCDNKIRDTEFLISGCTENLSFGYKTYRVSPIDKTVSMCRDVGNFGASFSGVTDVAYSMMNKVNYANMSLKEAIELTETTVSSNIIVYKYCNSQIIGGEMQTYVIDTMNFKSGWYKNSNIVSDDNAPDDGRRIYSDRMFEKMMKQRDRIKEQKSVNKSQKKDKKVSN